MFKQAFFTTEQNIPPSFLLGFCFIFTFQSFTWIDFQLWYNENNPNLAFTFTIYGRLCSGKGVVHAYNLST